METINVLLDDLKTRLDVPLLYSNGIFVIHPIIKNCKVLTKKEVTKNNKSKSKSAVKIGVYSVALDTTQLSYPAGDENRYFRLADFKSLTDSKRFVRYLTKQCNKCLLLDRNRHYIKANFRQLVERYNPLSVMYFKGRIIKRFR